MVRKAGRRLHRRPPLRAQARPAEGGSMLPPRLTRGSPRPPRRRPYRGVGRYGLPTRALFLPRLRSPRSSVRPKRPRAARSSGRRRATRACGGRPLCRLPSGFRKSPCGPLTSSLRAGVTGSALASVVRALLCSTGSKRPSRQRQEAWGCARMARCTLRGAREPGSGGQSFGHLVAPPPLERSIGTGLCRQTTDKPRFLPQRSLHHGRDGRVPIPLR